MPVNYVSSGAVAGDGLETELVFTDVNAGAGDLLLVLAVRRVGTTGDILSGVLFGATPLTELFQFNPFDGSNDTAPIAAFYLLSPVGIDTIAATFSAPSVAGHRYRAGITDWLGRQLNPHVRLDELWETTSRTQASTQDS